MIPLLCHHRSRPTTGARITSNAAAGIFAEYGAREKAVSRVKSWPVRRVHLNRLTFNFSHNRLRSYDSDKG